MSEQEVRNACGFIHTLGYKNSQWILNKEKLGSLIEALTKMMSDDSVSDSRTQ